MKPSSFDFETHSVGDSVREHTFTLTRTVDGVTSPEDLTGASVVFEFTEPDGTCWFEATQENSGVSVAGNVVTLHEFLAHTESGNYRYRMTITYTTELVRTYLVGRLPVIVGSACL